MVLRIHGKDESVVRFRQGAPEENYSDDSKSLFLFIKRLTIRDNLLLFIWKG